MIVNLVSVLLYSSSFSLFQLLFCFMFLMKDYEEKCIHTFLLFLEFLLLIVCAYSNQANQNTSLTQDGYVL